MTKHNEKQLRRALALLERICKRTLAAGRDPDDEGDPYYHADLAAAELREFLEAVDEHHDTMRLAATLGALQSQPKETP